MPSFEIQSVYNEYTVIEAIKNTLMRTCISALAIALFTAAMPDIPAFAAAGGEVQGTEDVDGAAKAAPEEQRNIEATADIPPVPQIKEPTDNGFVVARSSITAQVQTDASMHASVRNNIKAGKGCDVFFWSLASLNGHSETVINSVRMAYLDDEGKMLGDWISLAGRFFDADQRAALSRLSSTNASFSGSEAAAAGSRTWMFDSSESMLYAFFAPPSDAEGQNTDAQAFIGSTGSAADIVIDIDYTVTDAVMAYDDVGEMYWYYISGGNNMPIWDVSAVIQLPVPHGMEVESGETAIAWGHGAPGTVDMQPDGTIHYEAPYVASGQYMMAHIIFPVSWLENISPETRQLHSGIRKAYAVEGEDVWTDVSAANIANALAVDAAIAIICALGLAAAIAIYLMRGRENMPSESDMRAIAEMSPEQLRQRMFDSMSPAVAARLMRNDRQSEADFTESIEHLMCTGAITMSIDPTDAPAIPPAYSLSCAPSSVGATIRYPRSEVAERILQQRHAPNALAAIRLHIGKDAKDRRLSPIEHETMRVLFEDIAEGYPTLPASEVHDFAKAKPARFIELMQGWQGLLSSEVSAAGVFDDRGIRLRKGIGIAAVVYLVLGIACGIAFASPIAAACGIVTATTMAVITSRCSKRTLEGTKLALMSEALESKEKAQLDAYAAADPVGSSSKTSHADSDSSVRTADASAPAAPAFPSADFTKMLEDDLAAAYKRI